MEYQDDPEGAAAQVMSDIPRYPCPIEEATVDGPATIMMNGSDAACIRAPRPNLRFDTSMIPPIHLSIEQTGYHIHAIVGCFQQNERSVLMIAGSSILLCHHRRAHRHSITTNQ